ncbi:MAG: metal-dependent hydrolase [Nanoarchaeota archaeon]|nr:metal-dependent hydrolase [Nanoarchaeota archaeon]
MPLAVTHVLSSIILVDLFRDYIIKKHKKYLTLHTIMIAGIAGLLPDIDVPINWLLGFLGYSFELLKHGGLTHTAFFGLIFLIPGFILWNKKKHKIATYFFVITFGILLHVSLDFILGGGAYEGIMWLWPFSSETFKLHLLRNVGIHDLPVAIDAVLLLTWLWHEEVKHKIKDFI